MEELVRDEGMHDDGTGGPTQGIDRRGFLGGSLAGRGMLALGSLAACAPSQGGAAQSSAAAAATEPAEEFVADETVEADVIVVGCGAGGFMTSIVAAKKGAKVITLEKGANLGAPNGVYVSGPFAVDTDVLRNKEGGTTLTVDEVFHHVMEYSHWTPNPPLIRRCLENS